MLKVFIFYYQKDVAKVVSEKYLIKEMRKNLFVIIYSKVLMNRCSE